MLEMFGLSIIIEVTDRATDRLHKVNEAMGLTGQTAQTMRDQLNDSFSTLSGEMFNANMMVSAGNQMINTGLGMLNIFKELGSQVVATNSYFEGTKITLQTLYQDVEKGNEMVKWGLDYALRTPFGIEEVQNTIVGLKAIGVEADQMVTSATGHTQELLGFIGDLGALRPDVGMERMAYAIRNALGGQVRSLKMALDVDVDDIIGRKFGDNPVQDIADLVSGLKAEGLMSRMFGTWSQMISETKDQFTRLYLAMGDAGAFDSMKEILADIYGFVSKIPEEDVTAMGENLSSIFKSILVPVRLVVKGFIFIADKIKDIIVHNPGLVEFASKFLVLASGATVFSGVLLSLIGISKILSVAFSFAKTRLFLFADGMGVTITEASTLKGVLFKLMLQFSKTGVKLAFFYGLWKMNFLNMRDIAENTLNAVSSGLQATEMEFEEFTDYVEELMGLDNAFANLELFVIKAKLLIQGLIESFAADELSEEMFLKLEKLNLLPIIENFIELKWVTQDFFKGFKTGVEDVIDFVRELGFVADFISGALDKVFTLIEWFTGINPLEGSAEDLGKFAGRLVSVIGLIKAAGVIFKPIKWLLTALGSNFTGGGIVGAILKFVQNPLVVKTFFLIKSALSGIMTVGKALFTSVILPIFTFVGGLAGGGAVLGAAIVAAVAFVSYMIISNWEKVTGFIGDGIEWTKEKFSQAKEFTLQKVEELVSWLSGKKEQVVTGVDNLKTAFLEKVDEIKAWIETKVESLRSFLQGTKDAVKEAWDRFIDSLKEAPTIFFNWLEEKFSGAAKTLSNLQAGWSEFKEDPKGFTVTKIKQGAGAIRDKTNEMLQFDTGAYIKEDGVGMLHKDEVVINNPVTRKLEEFLAANRKEGRPVASTTNDYSTLSNRIINNSTMKNETSSIINNRHVINNNQSTFMTNAHNFIEKTGLIAQTEEDNRRHDGTDNNNGKPEDNGGVEFVPVVVHLDDIPKDEYPKFPRDPNPTPVGSGSANVSYSTKIEKGAIVIEAGQYSESEKESLAKYILDEIKAREEFEKMKNYEPLY